MIIFLLIFLPLIALIGLTGHYVQVTSTRYITIASQAARIERLTDELKQKDREIAGLRQELATSEAVRAEMFDLIQNSADVVRDRDSELAQLRGWITIATPKWRWN